MASNEKQITVKVCECYSHYFDKDVSDSSRCINFFSQDSDSTINRINDEIILKYCYNCLKEKFLKKEPSIVSDSQWIDLRRFNDCYKNAAVASSGCLARFLCNEKEFFEICNNCVNFAINTI